MNDKLSIIIGNKKFSAFVAGLVFLLIIPLVIQFILIAQSDIDGHEKKWQMIKSYEKSQ